MVQASVWRYLTPSRRKAQSVGLIGGGLALTLVLGCTIPENSDAQSPDTPVAEQPTTPPEFVPESVSDRVLATAAQDFNVPQTELTILRFNQETWSDSCLGLGKLNESCLQTLVDGWQLEVIHENQSWFYRTDATGEAIRQSDLEHNLPPSVSALVLQMASSDAGVSVSQLQVTEAEPKVWNGCFGIAEPDAVCTEIAILGWRAVVEGATQRWVYHTDMTGSDIRLNDRESEDIEE